MVPVDHDDLINLLLKRKPDSLGTDVLIESKVKNTHFTSNDVFGRCRHTGSNEHKPHQEYGNRTRHKLSYGDDNLDTNLNGGLEISNITEISGKSGSGKTILSYQLMVSVQMPLNKGGLCGNAIYLYTTVFDARRLLEIAESMRSRSGGCSGLDLMKNIMTSRIVNLSHQLYLVCYCVEFLIRFHNVKLIVFDSFSYHFRRQHKKKRKRHILFQLISRLKKFAYEYKTLIVLVNEMTSVMESLEYSTHDGPGCITFQKTHYNLLLNTEDKKSIPALGLSWEYCLDHRVFLEKTSVGRKIHAYSCSHNTVLCDDFKIDKRGIRSIQTP